MIGSILGEIVGLFVDDEVLAIGILAIVGAAAAIAFIDPGLAKDKDCSTVLAQAHAGIT